MKSVNQFVARFQDMTPVMVNGDQEMRFQASLTGLAERYDDRELAAKSDSGDDFWFSSTDWRSALRPYNVKNGILQVPVKGVLLHNFGYAFFDYATGYIYIEQAIRRGLGDKNVKGIALVIDSPGGEVAGCFSLVDKIFGWRGEKPIRAFASESAYSAAYAVASAADSITVSKTGGVGSIGVLTSHVDVSKMMDNYGYKITFIFAGKHKVDGNPYEALKPEVKERIQARIDELYSIFVSSVARNRDMDEKAVRKTEALTFTASEATSNGLADNIGDLDDSMAAFAVELDLEDGDDQMAGEKNDATANTVDIEKVKAEAFEAGKAEGVKAGGAAMQERISAIFALPEAAARPATANMLAFDTDKSPEACAASLAKVPEEKPAASTEKKNETAEGFHETMNKQPKIDVGNAGEEDAAATEKANRRERAIAAATPAHNRNKTAA